MFVLALAPWALQQLNHRVLSIHIERANMHCQGIACTRSFYVGLTSAGGKKLECFKRTVNKIFLNAMKNTYCLV